MVLNEKTRTLYALTVTVLHFRCLEAVIRGNYQRNRHLQSRDMNFSRIRHDAEKRGRSCSRKDSELFALWQASCA